MCRKRLECQIICVFLIYFFCAEFQGLRDLVVAPAVSYELLAHCYTSCQQLLQHQLSAVTAIPAASSYCYTSCQQLLLHQLPAVTATPAARSYCCTSCQQLYLHQLPAVTAAPAAIVQNQSIFASSGVIKGNNNSIKAKVTLIHVLEYEYIITL